VSIFTTYLVPLLVIILSYGRLLSHISKNQRQLAKFRHNNNNYINNNTNNKNRDTKVTKKNSKSKRNAKETLKTEYQSLKKANGDKGEENYPIQKSNMVLMPIDVNMEKETNTATPTRSKSLSKKKQPQSSNKRKKVTKMVAVVTANFAGCWAPTHLLIILRGVLPVNQNSELIVYLHFFKLLAHTLSYITPCINPILYAFYNENFRTPLIDIWNRATCRISANNHKSGGGIGGGAQQKLNKKNKNNH
jgi:hypothetical protein